MDVAISVEDFYTFTLESALEPLPQVFNFEFGNYQTRGEKKFS
jgi:hypothetical protein